MIDGNYDAADIFGNDMQRLHFGLGFLIEQIQKRI